MIKKIFACVILMPLVLLSGCSKGDSTLQSLNNDTKVADTKNYTQTESQANDKKTEIDSTNKIGQSDTTIQHTTQVTNVKDNNAESSAAPAAESSAKDAEPAAQKVDMLDLPSALSDIYNKYSIDKNDELLRGLQPLDVCKLYFFAEDKKDYETVYALYIHDENWLVPSKEDYLKGIQNDSAGRQNFEKLLKELKEDIRDIAVLDKGIETCIVIKFNKDIFWGGTIEFKTVKDKKGIWKVRFMPLQ